ncbi:MAG: phosphoribosyltransferase family protein [Acidobacteriota bacterium]
MELLPTPEEVIDLLRSTGGLRNGHFEYPAGPNLPGWHSSEALQVALTMRDFQAAKILSVALSRKLRSNSDIRAMLPNVSVVAPATGGLPVAFGVAEALRASKVYWAERMNQSEPLRFRQHLVLDPGERVLLVDDICRTGTKLSEMKQLVESAGGEVVAMAVIAHEPRPNCASFGTLPFYYLAKLDVGYADAATCSQCKAGEPVEKIWV